MSFSEANVLLEQHMQELGLVFEREYKFHPKRKWRFDYFIYAKFGMVGRGCGPAVEIEGGIYSRGRHVRGKGYENDLEKYREAAALGYKVYRFSTQEVLNGTAREFIKEHCL